MSGRKERSAPRVAVIGCGNWGANLVRNYSEMGVLAAVSDLRPDSARRLSDQYKVPATTTDRILEDEFVEGVVIAVTAKNHFALAREALEAGKHVFVEKPLALKVKEAEELCRFADQRGRILMVGHLIQYHPAFRTLNNMVSKGDLGGIQYIYANRLNLGRFRTEENILWSFAPHDISMILALIGEMPNHIEATGHGYLHAEISDVTTTHLEFESGQAAHVFVSWLHPFKEHRLVVIGDLGMMVFDDGKSWDAKLLLYRHNIDWHDGTPTANKAEGMPVPVEPEEPLKAECRHFLECIEREETPVTDGQEGLRVLKVLRAAELSMRT